MLISASFSQLKQHLDLLYQESKIVNSIEALLNQRYQQALANPHEDAGYYLRQLQFAREEAQRIRQRKELLGNTLEALSDANNDLKEKIAELSHWLRSIN